MMLAGTRSTSSLCVAIHFVKSGEPRPLSSVAPPSPDSLLERLAAMGRHLSMLLCLSRKSGIVRDVTGDRQLLLAGVQLTFSMSLRSHRSLSGRS
jgi:hypothetical protein